MLYALVFRPKIDTSKINSFRLKYDPHFNLIEPHITIVFPISDKNIDKKILIKHIEKILNKEKSFKIHLQGLEKSWDHWLNLILKEGNNQIISLHDQLYTGILTPFFRKDINYIPHIGLGLFTSKNSDYQVTNPIPQVIDSDNYKIALSYAETLNFDYQTILDNLELITLDDTAAKIVDHQQFILNPMIQSYV